MRKKIIKICILIVLVALIVVGLFNLINSEVQAIEVQNVESRVIQVMPASSIGELVSGEIDPETYKYEIHPGVWHARSDAEAIGDSHQVEHTEYYMPIRYKLNGEKYKIYCIYPGQPLNYKGEITYKEAQNLNGKTYTEECTASYLGELLSTVSGILDFIFDKYWASPFCAEQPQLGKMISGIRFAEEGYTSVMDLMEIPQGVGNSKEYDLPVAAAYLVSLREGISSGIQTSLWQMRGEGDCNINYAGE